MFFFYKIREQESRTESAHVGEGRVVTDGREEVVGKGVGG
jgi:hypothetical protein